MGFFAALAIIVITVVLTKDAPDIKGAHVFMGLCALFATGALVQIASNLDSIKDTLEDWRDKAHPQKEE